MKARLSAGEWRAVGAITVMVSSIQLEFYGVPIVLPVIASEFGLSSSAVEWILNAQLLAFAAPLIAFGRLADRIGRRRLAILGVTIFGVSTVAIGFSPDATVIIGLRVVQGIGSAMAFAPAIALASQSVAADKRPTALGICTGGYMAFGAAGPVVAGVLTDVLSWRWFFISNGILGVLGLACVMFFVREHEREPGDTPFDALGFVVLTTALALVVLGLQLINDVGLISPWVLGCILVSIVLMFAFYRIEKAARSPLFDMSLLANRDVAGICLYSFLGRFPYAVLLLILPLYIQYMLGYSASTTGLVFVALMLAITMASFMSGRAMAVLQVRQLLSAAMASMSLSFVCFGFVSYEPAIVLIPIGLALFGLGTGMLIAVSNTVAIDAVSEKQSAVASSLLVFVRNLAPPIGVASLMVLFRLWEHNHLARMLDLAGNSISESAHATIFGVLSGSDAAREKLLALAPGIADRVDFVIDSAFEHAFRNVMFVSLAISVLGLLTVYVMSGLSRAAGSSDAVSDDRPAD